MKSSKFWKSQDFGDEDFSPLLSVQSIEMIENCVCVCVHIGDGAPGTEEAGGENSEEKPPEQEEPKAEQVEEHTHTHTEQEKEISIKLCQYA